MLSCECGFDTSDFDEWYYSPNDFSSLNSSRRKRCVSCKKLIDVDSTVVEFPRFRHPNSDIEERCKGEEVQLASLYMCEKCGEIFLNLDALGFCMDIYKDSMDNCLAEYHKMTGFKKEEAV